MERSKKGNLQLSKTTLTSLSGGGYMYSWGKGNAKYGKAGLGKGKYAGKDLMFPSATRVNECIQTTGKDLMFPSATRVNECIQTTGK